MPHFILDCSESVFETHSEEEILEQVHLVANSTGLFDEGDIKVRVNPYKTYLVGGKKKTSFTYLHTSWKVGVLSKKQIYQEE